MKNNSIILLIALLGLLSRPTQASPLGTAFTYQGRLSLNGGGNAINGLYDFSFKVFDDATAGTAQGLNPLNLTAVPVTDGFFLVTLDFGAGVFPGDARWLDISVKTNGAPNYDHLLPRQPLTPAPYALFTPSAARFSGSLGGDVTGPQAATVVAAVSGQTAANVAAGASAANAATSANTPGTIVKRDGAGGFSAGSIGLGTPSPSEAFDVASGNVLIRGPGGFTKNGDAAYVYLGDHNHYLEGVYGYGLKFGTWPGPMDALVITENPPGYVGIGTTSPQAKLEVNGPVLADGDLLAPRLNVGLGHTLNGAWTTIAGGYLNTASQDYATVSGGRWNVASGVGAVVGGGGADGVPRMLGQGNTASGPASTVGGGVANLAGGSYATVAGGLVDLATNNYATVAGGAYNIAGAVSTTVAGGYQNSALGQDSTVGGGYTNTASGLGATVPGGYNNYARGAYSFAAGYSAYAYGDGSVVFADSQAGTFSGKAYPDEFAIRARSGVYVQSDVGIHLNARNCPLITRDWDRFDNFAPGAKSYVGRWGLFMEPYALALGIPATDVGPRRMAVLCYNTDGSSNEVFSVGNDGVTVVKVLQINGGSDLAEPFAVSDLEPAPKGSVMIIDDLHPGQLRVSTQPYDKRVAGVVSGAGGMNPGLTIAQQGVTDKGSPVALSGRVYTLADTSNGSIQPGNLLTTSATPGHAMKATDPAKAQGAIIGKAMGELKTGKGLILVLVSLQ